MLSTTESTFECLIKRHRQGLAAAAYHLSGDREAAQDIVQETLVDACRGFGALREPDRAAAWLYAILRRKAAAYRQQRDKETRLLDEPIVGDGQDAESLVRAIVVERMEAMSSEDREILAGKYLLGLSYKELAESLGIKEGALRVRCLRAKERLREALSGVGLKTPPNQAGG